VRHYAGLWDTLGNYPGSCGPALGFSGNLLRRSSSGGKSTGCFETGRTRSPAFQLGEPPHQSSTSRASRQSRATSAPKRIGLSSIMALRCEFWNPPKPSFLTCSSMRDGKVGLRCSRDAGRSRGLPPPPLGKICSFAACRNSEGQIAFMPHSQKTILRGHVPFGALDIIAGARCGDVVHEKSRRRCAPMRIASLAAARYSL